MAAWSVVLQPRAYDFVTNTPGLNADITLALLILTLSYYETHL